MIASFIIECIPVAKGRARHTVRGGFARAYTPAKTRAFEAMVAENAKAAVGPIDPYEGPVSLEAHFSMPIPKSWSKRNRLDALEGRIRHTSKPDLSNLIKAIEDAMNGIVYRDDGQIVATRITKNYGAEPGVAVSVYPA